VEPAAKSRFDDVPHGLEAVLDTVLEAFQPVLQPLVEPITRGRGAVVRRGARPVGSRNVVIRHATRLLGTAEPAL
jgi:hypothetical protein